MRRARADLLSPVAQGPWPAPARAWWLVAVLTFAYIVSFIDRTVLSLLIEPIKADLDLSDTQIALVQGLAFGVFYAVMGLPLGWLADRVTRKWLVSVGATLWCLATAASGLAGNFVHLFLARIGVGVGEAALSPAAMSLISDSFPRERRALPIGVYAAAGAIGSGLALIAGGGVIRLLSSADSVTWPLLGELRTWQVAFIAIGIAGLVLLPLLASVREPLRRNEFAAHADSHRIGAFVRGNADFMVRHYVAVSGYSILIYAVLSWVPVHFIRVFGWSAADTGLRYGVLLLVFGGSGTLLGAALAAGLARHGVRHAAILVTSFGMLAAGLLLAMAGRAATPATALAWYAPGLLCLTLPGGTAIQVVQEAVPNQLRGQASAIFYMMNSIVGLSLGPLCVALLTDYAFGDPMAVGSSMALVSILIGPAAALLAFSTRRPFGRLVGGHPR